MNRFLTPSFFERDAKTVARELIGAHLKHEEVFLRITETEAYCWPDDSANHCYKGKTKRNQAMWGPAGRAYIYICYGLHTMLNIVTNKKGEGAAVLIRSCDIIKGEKWVRERRSHKQGPVLLTGPGKVGQALALDKSFNHHPLYRSGGLEIYQGESLKLPLLMGPRVGIEYAKEKDQKAPWRFALADSPWVSHRNKLQPFQ